MNELKSARASMYKNLQSKINRHFSKTTFLVNFMKLSIKSIEFNKLCFIQILLRLHFVR